MGERGAGEAVLPVGRVRGAYGGAEAPPFRHRRFFSLAELNAAIRERLEALNQRPFRKRPGCRASLFQELDRPALGPLPRERYEFHQWATVRVNIDYHVEIERHYYSVPYQVAEKGRQPVILRSGRRRRIS